MRCGLVLSTMYPLGRSPRLAIDDWLAAAERAAQYDFDVLLAGQHFLHDDLQMFQPIPLLARAAGVAGGMRLGTGVLLLLPLQNPVRVAEDIAALDAVSGGRAVFGVGMGYRAHEFASFGVSLQDRTGRMEEGLAVIRALWRSDGVHFAGRHFRLVGVSANPKPLQPGGPPVWIAAHADAAVRRVARIGDAWLISPHSALAVVERQLALYRTSLAESDRVGGTILERETHIGATDAEALREAAP